MRGNPNGVTCTVCGAVGLSPRLRGNLVFSVTINDGEGSIPALAGEPGCLLLDGIG